MSPWQLMTLPFLECLVLVGIHSYLGIHVIKRKVIFVDLALAQIAALGSIVAFLFGLHPHTPGAYVFSLLFTFIGAALFSLTRLRDEKIPQEAVIGLVYALAAAVAILIIDRAPHGAEHIKEVLTGSILWVKWQTVLIAAVVYAAVGVFHYIFREKFLLISNDPEEAYRRGISVRLWDFLFYMSFGLVITLSVNTAGVLLVFVFLVVPAIMAIMITDNLKHQLMLGWGAGTIVSFVGLTASYAFDFPTGPMVVTVYGAALVLVALVIYVVRSKNRLRSWMHIGAGAAIVLFVSVGFYYVGNFLLEAQKGGSATSHDHEHAGHNVNQASSSSMDTAKAERSLLEQLEPLDMIAKKKLLDKFSDRVELKNICSTTDDDEIRLMSAERLFSLDKTAGIIALIEIMEKAEIPLFRSEALSLLTGQSGNDFGFDPMDDPDSKGNLVAIKKWREWQDEQQHPSTTTDSTGV